MKLFLILTCLLCSGVLLAQETSEYVFLGAIHGATLSPATPNNGILPPPTLSLTEIPTTNSYLAGLGFQRDIIPNFDHFALGIDLGSILPGQGKVIDNAVGTFSPDAYFHWAFFNSALEPYFMGGYSLLFQTSTANYYNLGFGVRYWTGLNQTFGFMAEGRHFSHINNSTLFNNQNFWEIRFGVTFRQK